MLRGSCLCAIAVIAGLLGAPAQSAAAPRCFGAAVRAYVHPCHDKSLRYMSCTTERSAAASAAFS